MYPSLGLDHVYLRVQHLNPLLAFFQDCLGLPLSWPVRDEAFARYAWVNAGNVQLELWQARSNEDLPFETKLPCIAGIALWPLNVHQARQSLEGLGVACKDPKTLRTISQDGELADNFTNCLVTDASSPACQVFFCQWNPHAPITPWPKGESTASRRERFAKELAATGGTIGVLGLQMIHMQAIDPDATARVWVCLTGEHGYVAPDIALSISKGSKIRITALVFCVCDLSAAASALKSQGTSTIVDGNILWIDERSTHGLRVGLSER